MVAACGGTDATSGGEDGQDDNLTSSSVAKELRGSWVGSDSTVGSMAGLDLRPDGKFFYDTHKVLNGMFVNGFVPTARTEGTYTIKSSKSTLTLHATSPQAETTVYTFKYTPAPIMNGVFRPGFEPEPKLTLTPQPAPGSHVAFPSIQLTGAHSWCTTDADCRDEKADGTWTNIGSGTISCQAMSCAPSLHL
jgi:hypothetical protein